MVTKEQILTACADTKRPCIRAVAEPEKAVSHTDSKFGGAYYLPAGSEASAMELLAQVNFAQAPRLQGFPEKGLLQFFLCTDQRKIPDDVYELSAWRTDSGLFEVRWYPEASGGAPQEETVPEERGWVYEKLTGGMRFEPAEETATLAVGSEEDCVADLGYASAAKAVLKLFIDGGENEDEHESEEDDGDITGYDMSDCGGVDDFTRDFGNWGCKLGGHPSLRYEDIRLNNEAHAAYSVLLFQYDLTPDAADGEADTLCFFIKPEDLEARRFDDILLTHHNCY